MSAQAAERRLAAILHGDVVGSSRLMAEDEDAAIRLVTAYREEIELLTHQHQGRLVDFHGDEFLAEFSSAVHAVQGAIEIQSVLRARNAHLPPEQRMEFRMGVHLGEVRSEGERVFGVGVSVAARLQAQAEPGGLCISGEVHKELRNRLELTYEDLGEQEVKNIPEPVQVFRVKIEPEAVPEIAPSTTRRAVLAVLLGAGFFVVLAAGAWGLRSLYLGRGAIPGHEAFTIPGFSAPAIAVLPFDNLSGDPDQEYFAFGVTDQLITRLSNQGSFPVIARNSSFTYRGQAVDVMDVARELGTRYIVEGTVSRAGDRVRVTAQLIDGNTGHHVWADTYDRQLKDIFAVQDEITESIVVSLYPELVHSELERAARLESGDPGPWDLYARAAWHFFQLSKEDNAKARAFLERAIELEPSFALAWSLLAVTHGWDLDHQWTEAPEKSLEELEWAAQRCSALDNRSAQCSYALSRLFTERGQRKQQMAALQRALELNPSHAPSRADLGVALWLEGKADEAIPHLEKALRLDPRNPWSWAFEAAISGAHFGAGRYEAAIDRAEQSLRLNPENAQVYSSLAASYAELGRLDEAREAVREGLRIDPDLSLGKIRAEYSSVRQRMHSELLGRWLDALHRAGLPE